MLYVFKTVGRKIEYSPKKKRASSRLRKDNAAENFGETALCPNCWNFRWALSQSILDNWAVFQKLQHEILKGRVDSRVQIQVIYVQTQMQKINFFFGKQMGVLVLRQQTTHPLLCNTYTFICHIIKLSKLQKLVFHNYKI